MDPNATLQRYLDAYADDDRAELTEAADDYNAWIGRGGFPAELTDGRKVFGLSANYSEGPPSSPVGDGKSPDTFLDPDALREASC
ncbi:MAG: hypothetical protein GY769_20205 [bacterium]|nr:hypothetical protein [bacterium]